MGFGFGRGGFRGGRGGGRGGGRRPSGPRLPDEIMGRLRADGGVGSGARGSAKALSRKEERKAARQAKKQNKFAAHGGGRVGGSGHTARRGGDSDEEEDEEPPMLEPMSGRKRQRGGEAQVAAPSNKRSKMDPAVASAALARGYDLHPEHVRAAGMKSKQPAAAAGGKGGAKGGSNATGRSSKARDYSDSEDDDDDDDLSDIEEDDVPGAVDLRGKGAGGSGAAAKKPAFLMADNGDEDADMQMIRDLERKLGIKRGGRLDDDAGEDAAAGMSKRNRRAIDKLNKEFAKDGLGDDFGDFLDGLDGVLDGDEDEEEYDDEGEDDEEEDEDGALADLPTDIEDEDEEEEGEAPDGMEEAEDGDEEDDEEDEAEAEGEEEDESGDGEDEELDEDDEEEEEELDDEGEEEASSDEEEEEDEEEGGSEPEDASPAKPAPASAPAPGKYVPPHLRKQMAAAADAAAASAASTEGPAASARAKPSLYGDNEVGGAAGTGRRSLDPSVQAAALASTTDTEAVRAVRRRVQGLMNRLGESNIEPIAQELAGVYRTHATADCNAAVMGIMLDACASEVQVLRPLVRIFAALLSALHILVGPVVGAHALEWVTLKFAEAAALPQDPNPTEADLIMSADDLAALGSKAAPASSRGGGGNALTELLGDGSGARSSGASASKLRNNLLLLLGYLYVFHVTYSDLFTGVLRLLVARFSEADVELLLLALTHIGFQLRTDDPVALRDILRAVQAKATAAAEAEAAAAAASGSASASRGFASSDGTLSSLVAAFAPRGATAGGAGGEASSGEASSSRMRIMMELVLDIKNNRKRVEHEQMLERGAQLRKWLGRLAGKTTGVEGMERRLRITWSDLMLIPQRGRWWLVGASWVGRAASGAGSQAAEPTRLGKAGGVFDEVAGGGGGAGSAGAGGADATRVASMSATDAKLWALAREMRMNTAARKSVFVAIMGAEDVESALDRVLRLGLKGPAERDIVRVLLDCCGQEEAYNAYYALVGAKLCSYHHRFKFTFQLAFWDAFKSFEEADGGSTPRRVYNLARMFADMVRTFSLALTVLKPLDITSITADVKRSPKSALFLKAVFTSLFIDVQAAHDLTAMFTRLGAGPDKLPLRDALLVFLHNHVPVKTIVAAQTARPRDASKGGNEEAPDQAFYTAQRKAVLKALESVQGDRPEDGLD